MGLYCKSDLNFLENFYKAVESIFQILPPFFISNAPLWSFSNTIHCQIDHLQTPNNDKFNSNTANIYHLSNVNTINK